MPNKAKPFGARKKLEYGRPHRRRKEAALQRAGYRCECQGCASCLQCDERKCGRIAEIGEHLQAHRGNPHLMNDPTNYAAFCLLCAKDKTARGE